MHFPFTHWPRSASPHDIGPSQLVTFVVAEAVLLSSIPKKNPTKYMKRLVEDDEK